MSRAIHIQRLFLPFHQLEHYYASSSPSYPSSRQQGHGQYSPDIPSYSPEYPEEHYRQQQHQPYQHGSPDPLSSLEYELRRQNPDLLDKLRFAMGDKRYGVLAQQIAKGAFFAAAVYGLPFVVGPLLAVQAITRSRRKQIERRDMGLKPRYHIRPDDTY